MTRPATVAVDVGGTFTDITLLTGDGRAYSTKVRSDPDHPERPFAEGLKGLLEDALLNAHDVGRVVHATTLATNCVIEQTGPQVALVTTRGFRHVLEIGRHDGPRRSSMLTWRKPKRPITPQNVFEVDERIATDGTVLKPLDEDGCRQLGRLLRDRGINSVAVCLLNSYASGLHEERAAELISSEHPSAAISISTQVLPSMREYERSLATALDAYVKPVVDAYLQRVERVPDAGSNRLHVLVMQSNGGQISTGEARRRPISLVLSGPAAGAMGSAYVAKTVKARRAISIDMGGTSTDVCVLHGGEADSTQEAHVGPWPFAIPSVEVHTIGAGGGSIARVARDGAIVVGPDSAGTSPGPASYGSGGTRPTVTDANLVLGRLPDRIGDGRIALDVAAARAAIERHIASPLGIDCEAAAAGVIDVVNASAAGAIRLLTTQRGRDTRDYALIAAGGAGPLHAAAIAQLLGCASVVIPISPGVQSTVGLLQGRLKRHFAATFVRPLKKLDSQSIDAAFERLESQAASWFDLEEVSIRRRRIERRASVHYMDQVGAIDIRWTDIASVEDSLGRAHKELFGFVPAEPGELLALGVVATATGREPAMKQPVSHAHPSPHRRRIYVDRRSGYVECDVYDRPSLAEGRRVSGPVIVEQMDSTTYVPPGFHCQVDRLGNLRLAAA